MLILRFVCSGVKLSVKLDERLKSPLTASDKYHVFEVIAKS